MKLAASDQANWSGTAGANTKPPQVGESSGGFMGGLAKGIGASVGGIGTRLLGKSGPRQATGPSPTQQPRPQLPMHQFMSHLGNMSAQQQHMNDANPYSQMLKGYNQHFGLGQFQPQKQMPSFGGSPVGHPGGQSFDFSQLGGQAAEAQPEQSQGLIGKALDWYNSGGQPGETLGQSALHLPAEIGVNYGFSKALGYGIGKAIDWGKKLTGIGSQAAKQAPGAASAAQGATQLSRLGRMAAGAKGVGAWNTGIDALKRAPDAIRNYHALATGGQYNPEASQTDKNFMNEVGQQNFLRRAWSGWSNPITSIAAGAHAIPELMELRQKDRDFAYRTRGTLEQQINRAANSSAAGIADHQAQTPDLWYQDPTSGQMLPTKKWMASGNSPEDAAQRQRVTNRLGLPSGWSPAQ